MRERESVREGERVIEREGERETERDRGATHPHIGAAGESHARPIQSFAGDSLKYSDICAAGAGNDARLIQTVARQV